MIPILFHIVMSENVKVENVYLKCLLLVITLDQRTQIRCLSNNTTVNSLNNNLPWIS